MKQYEELSRMRVNEAIQIGLRSQAVHRARYENKHPATPASAEKVRRSDPRPSAQPGWITLFFYWLIGFGG